MSDVKPMIVVLRAVEAIMPYPRRPRTVAEAAITKVALTERWQTHTGKQAERVQAG
jgi:hypothetical protein